jgi:hypothetical protein
LCLRGRGEPGRDGNNRQEANDFRGYHSLLFGVEISDH